MAPAVDVLANSATFVHGDRQLESTSIVGRYQPNGSSTEKSEAQGFRLVHDHLLIGIRANLGALFAG
jgi:hypothetical protein